MRVLIIDDALRMTEALSEGLLEENYAVDVAGDGVSGLEKACTGNYDLVLLDVNLPGIDGFTVIQKLRAVRSDIPVIMITARDQVRDRIAGLDGGADDYMVKPFAFEELLARMRALLRRPSIKVDPVLRFEDLELDPSKGQASRGGRRLPLSVREFALLKVLMRHQGYALSRARLFEAVWGEPYDGTSNVLDVYINYLRNRLEDQGEARVVHTIRGEGYCFGTHPSASHP